MRTVPLSTAPDFATVQGDSRVLADLRLQVITPMFGGGVTTGHLDEHQLIRPASIRGHLRFWWRACNAARFDTLAELHERERALWGSAAAKAVDTTRGPGAIAVRVSPRSAGKPFAQADGPKYVLFPFVEEDNEGRIEVEFRLRLTLSPHAGRHLDWPDEAACREAAEGALWAWIVFGGIGARTRRGCGALRCRGDANEAGTPLGEWQLPASRFQPESDVKTWLQRCLDTHVPSTLGPLRSFASLAGCRIAIGQPERTDLAWQSAIQPLQEFTQAEGVGRNRRAAGSRRPGQSYWPEVGAVRRIRGITNFPDDDHGDEYTVAPVGGAGGNMFPRADLGMPRIVRVATHHSAPTGTVEGGEDKFTRMASPIVLKALAVPHGQAVPIALCLDAPHVWDAGTPGIRIKEAPNVALTPAPLDDPANPPTWPRRRPPHVDDSGVHSSRDAFMKYVLDGSGWTEVIR